MVLDIRAIMNPCNCKFKHKSEEGGGGKTHEVRSLFHVVASYTKQEQWWESCSWFKKRGAREVPATPLLHDSVVLCPN